MELSEIIVAREILEKSTPAVGSPPVQQRRSGESGDGPSGRAVNQSAAPQPRCTRSKSRGDTR
jgi:hypothetical protein